MRSSLYPAHPWTSPWCHGGCSPSSEIFIFRVYGAPAGSRENLLTAHQDRGWTLICHPGWSPKRFRHMCWNIGTSWYRHDRTQSTAACRNGRPAARRSDQRAIDLNYASPEASISGGGRGVSAQAACACGRSRQIYLAQPVVSSLVPIGKAGKWRVKP
jgi:hypothetical protein